MQLYLNQLLCEFQQSYGTQIPLFRFFQALQKQLGKSGYVGTVLMDLTKTCDCEPHDLTNAKLKIHAFDSISL